MNETFCIDGVAVTEVTSLDDERLVAFAHLTDTQLRNRLEPEKGLFIAESGKVISRALEAGLTPVSFLMDRKWLTSMRPAIERARKENPDVPVFIAERDLMEGLTGYDVTRGALAAFVRPPLAYPEELLKDIDRNNEANKQTRIGVLEDITNAANVGAIFRSAAALGIDALLLTPGCCDALYRRAVRVSMGAVFQVPWTYLGTEITTSGAHGNTKHQGGWSSVGIPKLHDLGYTIVSLALTDYATDIADPVLKQQRKLAIILGTEGEGIAQATLDASDFVAQIPMSHGVDSLNVSAASAVAFWELRSMVEL